MRFRHREASPGDIAIPHGVEQIKSRSRGITNCFALARPIEWAPNPASSRVSRKATHAVRELPLRTGDGAVVASGWNHPPALPGNPASGGGVVLRSWLRYVSEFTVPAQFRV